jgi:hydroxyacylglutathione hydrolase
VILHTLVAPYRTTNNYLIEVAPRQFVGVDCGSISPNEINAVLEQSSGELIAYFLTHAHGDHTVGIKAIWELYKIPIYCSAFAATDINDPRKNYSIYSEEIATFAYDLPFSTVEDGEIITIADKIFKIMMTPGHSPGCMVVFHEQAVFTGDFLMKEYKTPLNLPTSNRKAHADSKIKFSNYCTSQQYTYYPGHGASFGDLKEVF